MVMKNSVTLVGRELILQVDTSKTVDEDATSSTRLADVSEIIADKPRIA
jgi:hypothetical protein